MGDKPGDELGAQEAWTSDEDLLAAQARFAAQVPDLLMPAAYSVARRGPRAAELKFGHINRFSAVRPLPATVLATVCGYVATTGVYQLSYSRFTEAVQLLAPAEAATHIPHLNLWSWRELLAGASPESSFLAFFIARPDDPPVNADDATFRQLLVD